jgi:hypothetical protein
LKAQGYLYGHPEDADAVRARLRAMGRLVAAPKTAEPQALPTDLRRTSGVL